MKTFLKYVSEGLFSKSTDKQLHNLVKKVEKGLTFVTITNNKKTKLVKDEVYIISDIDTDGGYEPNATFTDAEGNKHKKVNLFDIDFK